MTNHIEGGKYQATKNLGAVEIAKLIRADIKAATKAGELPAGLKLSIRSDYNSINVRIVALPFNPISVTWAALTPTEREEYWSAQRKLTDEAKRIQTVLTTIHGAYNYDGSDIQSDYFNVRYYGSVSFDWGFLRQAEIDATAYVATEAGMAEVRAAQQAAWDTHEAELAAFRAERAAAQVAAEPIDFAADFGPEAVAAALAEFITEEAPATDAPTLGTIVPFRSRQVAESPDLAPVVAGPAVRVVSEEGARFAFWLGLD